MATFQELLAQAQASQPVPTWGVTDQSTGQWNPYDTAGVAPARDEWGNLAQGVEQRDVGLTSKQAMDSLLLGPGGEFVSGTLANLAQSAGLPADFDWTPYLSSGLEQHFAQFGREYDRQSTNYAHPIAAAVQNAAADYPQLAPYVAQVAPGSAVWNQGQQMMQAQIDRTSSTRQADRLGLASVAAAPFAAAYFAPAAGAAGAGGGAAAEGAALAGAASTPAMAGGAGAMGLSGTGLGAYGAGGTGATGIGGYSAADIAAGALPGGAEEAGLAAYTNIGTAAPKAAATSPLGKIWEGTAGMDDYLKLGGQVLPSLISAYGSQRQADAQSDLADRYFGMGAPYRSRLASLYDDPSAFLSSPEVQIPVQQGTDATARALSTGGNPAGSGRALQEIQNYSANQLFGRFGQEKDRLAGFGGLSGYNAAAPGAANAAINAQGQVYGDLGYGAGQVLNPQQTSLQALLKQYNLSQGLA
jgi:hypothetical protein